MYPQTTAEFRLLRGRWGDAQGGIEWGIGCVWLQS